MNNKYSGMTVNERLYVSGLIKEFDDAVKEKNVNKIIWILKEVELPDYATIDPILKHYGLKKKTRINPF